MGGRWGAGEAGEAEEGVEEEHKGTGGARHLSGGEKLGLVRKRRLADHIVHCAGGGQPINHPTIPDNQEIDILTHSLRF